MNRLIAMVAALCLSGVAVFAACYDQSEWLYTVPSHIQACQGVPGGEPCMYFEFQKPVGICWSGPTLSNKTCQEHSTMNVLRKKFTGVCSSFGYGCVVGEWTDWELIINYVNFVAVEDSSCGGGS